MNADIQATDVDITALTSEPGSSPECADSSHVAYSTEFIIGLVLAISSSAFIGTSFIVKKKGLLRCVCCVLIARNILSGGAHFFYTM